MPTSKNMGVPRHRIPKIFVACNVCQRGMRAVMGTPFAEGYHRRLICDELKGGCGNSFYTLTSYETGTFVASKTPFHDRPLTEREQAERLEWWKEQLIKGVKPVPADPFLHRLQEAMHLDEDVRSPTEQFMVELFETMKQEVRKMDYGE
jgi:hypothetical protein